MASTQLSAHLPADAKALAELRRRVNELLVSAGIAESNRRDALLVANELAANAIEHGSRTDEIEIQCSLDGRHCASPCSTRPAAPPSPPPTHREPSGCAGAVSRWSTG